jgi:hypothetical protein
VIKRNYLQILLILFVILLISDTVLAQSQTGSIWGKVTDDQGAALPGAAVTIASPALMGTQSFITTADGSYRFPSCPPGEYVAKVALEGFQVLERPGIIISVGSNVKVDFALQLSPVKEEVIVVANSPVVDVKSSKQTAVVTSDLIQNLPVARDVLNLSATAPSVIDGGNAMISTHGATLQQSRYVLDGVDITDPMHGYRSTEIAFDAVDEVEMGLSGLGADIPKTAAGYINVVTKSGGNRFSGSITGVYTGEKLFSSTMSETQLKAIGVGAPIFDKYSYDTSLTLGGPIIKDKLWFFLNPRYTDFTRGTNFIPFTNAIGTYYGPYDQSRQELTGLGKLTAQITKKLKFMMMMHYYDVEDEPAPGWTGPRRTWTSSAATLNDSFNLSSVLNYVMDQDTFIEARLGYGKRTLLQQDFYERGKWELEPFAYDRYFGTTWGLLSWNEDHRRKNLDLNLALTRYQSDFLGADHEIKVGVDYTWWDVKTSHFSKYPYETYWYNNTPWEYHDTSPYLGAFYVTNEGPEWNSNSQLNLGQRYGLFVQDAINIGRLTLNLGVRFDGTHYTRPEETRKGWVDVNNNGLANILLPEIFPTADTIAPEMKDLVVWNVLQPRIGLTFDLFGDGTTALKATYSRYAENLIASMMRGIHPFDPWVGGVDFLWYDNNQNGIRDLPPVDDYFPISIPKINIDPASLTNWMDPNLRSPYTDELTAGIEREIIRDFKLELRGIYRDMKNIPELIDTANPLDGVMWIPYTVTDPGNDGKLGTGDEQQLTVFAMRKDAPAPNRYLTNIEELRRKYWGIEFVMFKRMSNNWQFSGSVTYSKTYGNIQGGFTDSRMNLGTYMNPNNLINLWGRTNFDSPLMIKLMGTVILPYGLHMSAYFRHLDGGLVARTLTVYFPATVGGYATKVPSVTVRAEPLGSKRYTGTDILDFRLEKQFPLGFGILGMFVDAFNILGNENIYMNINNGGYIYADGSFKTFPQYGRYNSVAGTRSFQFTLRLQF